MSRARSNLFLLLTGRKNRCQFGNPDFPQSSELPLFTKGLRFYPKLRNNAEIEKHFWMICAVRPINKGISRNIEESPQGATTQIEADWSWTPPNSLFTCLLKQAKLELV